MDAATAIDLDVLDGRFAALLVAVTLAALLYSTSGHGGGTAYLALFGLFGVAPAVMRPLALVLNVVVAGIGAGRLIKAAVMPWRTIGFLLLGSVPGAFVGGLVQLPATAYRAVLGVLLLIAAARLFLPTTTTGPMRAAPAAVLVVLGLVLGVLSGLTGIGGGIFLSPILVLFRLEDPKRTAAAASAFILVNSIAGLVGQATHGALAKLPSTLPLLLIVVAVGGLLGSWLVARRLSSRGLRIALGIVLAVSGVRLVFEALAEARATARTGHDAPWRTRMPSQRRRNVPRRHGPRDGHRLRTRRTLGVTQNQRTFHVTFRAHPFLDERGIHEVNRCNRSLLRRVLGVVGLWRRPARHPDG